MKKISITKNVHKYFYIFIIIFFLLLTSGIVLAQEEAMTIKKGINNASTNLNPVAGGVGYGPNPSIEIVIGEIIRLILSFVGIIFLILIIVSGFQWMSAGGNEETIEKSKNRIKNAIYGLVIIFAAYAITTFITTLLMQKTNFQ